MAEKDDPSVSFRTYLFVEKIYLEAADESEDETTARGIMDFIWNLLTTEEQRFLESRMNAAGQVRCPACKGSGRAVTGSGVEVRTVECPDCQGTGCSNRISPGDDKGMKELEAAALVHGVKEGAQMSRFLLWVGNECFEGREVSNFMVLTARAKELVQMFLAQDHQKGVAAGKAVSLKTNLQVLRDGGRLDPGPQ